jgi:hypothetical protein
MQETLRLTPTLSPALCRVATDHELLRSLADGFGSPPLDRPVITPAVQLALRHSMVPCLLVAECSGDTVQAICFHGTKRIQQRHIWQRLFPASVTTGKQSGLICRG